MSSTVHVVGAGLSGLSAAVRLTAAGRRVVIHEASPRAGGRCRSYFDERLGCRIDNGNHLLLSGNRSVVEYLRIIAAEDTLVSPSAGRFPFLDLGTGERWMLVPGTSRLPYWILDPQRRVPGSRARDYLAALRLARARPCDTVEQILDGSSPLYPRFWAPMAVAVLNTEPSAAAASLLWPVLKETFGRGGPAWHPLIAREGLSESFVDPALAWLGRHGAELRLGDRLRLIETDGERVLRLHLSEGSIALGTGELVVLALPPAVTGDLVKDLCVPDEYRPIVNAHFVLDEAPVERPEILGLIGGTAEWIFRRGRLASVTVSAATALVDDEPELLARALWKDVAAALRRAGPMPLWRVVKEKRATFAQTPRQVARRPGPKTRWPNLFLAGDWTATGLPATIEGALRSGELAARCVLRAAPG